MNKLLSLLILALALALALALSAMAQDKKPNVILILIDDFGWKDVGYNGSAFYETPNMDKLAAESMKFNYCYAASTMCSPTRASILTGKSPARHGITQWLPGDKHFGEKYNCPVPTQFIKKEVVTIAEAFKEGGYETHFLGKWHMGKLARGGPKAHGYDTQDGVIEANSCQMFAPFERRPGIPKFFKNVKKGEYYSDKLTDRALDIINKKKEKPFYLYLAHFAMHYPIKSKPELKTKFLAKRQEMNIQSAEITDPFSWMDIQTNTVQHSAEYAGELFNLDQNIGRLVDALKESGQYENTIIILTGDNGGRTSMNLDKGVKHSGSATSITPLRGGKTFLYEGGLRTPLIIHWPGHTKAGSEDSTPVTSMDFYPTLLEMTGMAQKPEQHLDGVSLVPLIKGETIERDTLFWHFPHYQREGGSPATAVRVGDYKLVISYHYEKVELFNLKSDPNELTDLSSSMPEKVEILKKKVEEYLAETGGEAPTLNSGTPRPKKGKKGKTKGKKK